MPNRSIKTKSASEFNAKRPGLFLIALNDSANSLNILGHLKTAFLNLSENIS
jgi:hypothetical protein